MEHSRKRKTQSRILIGVCDCVPFWRIEVWLKEMQKYHIRNRSEQDGDQCLVFPFVGDEDDRCGEQFWYCGRDTARWDIFHTVDNQNCHDG